MAKGYKYGFLIYFRCHSDMNTYLMFIIYIILDLCYLSDNSVQCISML